MNEDVINEMANPPRYEWLFNQLLAKLSLHCSEGATMNYSGLQSKASEDSMPTSRGFLFDAEQWRRDWEREMARKRPEPERIIVDLIALLTSARWSAKRNAKVRGTIEWKQAIANDERGSRAVATLYGISHQTVCDYRKEYGEKDAA